MAGRPGEEKDRELQNAIGIATEIVDLLPDGMKENQFHLMAISFQEFLMKAELVSFLMLITYSLVKKKVLIMVMLMNHLLTEIFSLRLVL